MFKNYHMTTVSQHFKKWRTHLGGAGCPPADGLGGRGDSLSAEAPVLAAAVRERLGLQGFK